MTTPDHEPDREPSPMITLALSTSILLDDDGLDGNTLSQQLDEALELEGTGQLPAKVVDDQGNVLSVRSVLWDTNNQWFVLLAEAD